MGFFVTIKDENDVRFKSNRSLGTVYKYVLCVLDMAEKYIMFDVNDPNADSLAEVLSNKTSKKIIGLLAEREMTESDIAAELKLPLNTIDYNMKKLVNAGLIEVAKGFFWSVKGKKIQLYRLSNKKIVISPKTSFRGLIPAVLITGIIAFGVRYWMKGTEFVQNAVDSGASNGLLYASEKVAGATGVMASAPQVYSSVTSNPPAWLWFMFGAVMALVIFSLWNWRRIW